MTGGVAVVLGPTGANLGAGMTGGKVYLLDADNCCLNHHYVNSEELSEVESYELKSLLEEHLLHTGSEIARDILRDFEPKRFSIVKTRLAPETLPEWNIEASPSTR
jgi:glutamate synthase domain-containing protein 3